ncbi:MAG: laminin G domain-containing protein [Phycisphaerales bacterium]|nr:MAG: laminin G domain-containing protein [Phycisphaerales bacterium]
MNKRSLSLAALTLVLCISGRASAELLARWTFDEGAGTVAHDSMGNQHDGATVGDVVWVGGKLGGAINFNGAGCVEIPTDWASYITDEVTIAFWIYGGPEQPKVDRCFETARPGNEEWFNCTVPYKNGAVTFDAPYPDRITTYPDESEYKGRWNHYAFTKNRTTGEMRIYINGAEVERRVGRTLQMVPAEGFTQGTIGSGADGDGGYERLYYGVMDDVRIYNHELSAPEIWNLLIGFAWNPNPYDGAEGVSLGTVVSWSEGLGANSHDVYFGTDLEDVKNADSSWPVGTSVYKGNQSVDANNYDPGSLSLGQTYYWRVDENDGDSCWTGDVWRFTVDFGVADNPSPGNGATGEWIQTTLAWTPGNYASSHDVYFGTSFEDVNSAGDPCTPPGRGRQDANSYDPGMLELGKTYYWRIDEVAEGETSIIRGEVWNFTTSDFLVVDDMDSYTPWHATGDHIYETWTDGIGDCALISGNGTGAIVSLDTDIGDSNAMKYSYDNDGMVLSPCFGTEEPRAFYSQATAHPLDLHLGSGNFTEHNIRALSLSFYGDPCNVIEPMWVKLADGADANAVVTYGDKVSEDIDNLKDSSWHHWSIDLGEFADVNLADVRSISIGFGDPLSTSGGGTGAVYFDNIRLYPQRCVPEFAVGDFTGDCIAGHEDLGIMALDWLESASHTPGAEGTLAGFSGDDSQWVTGRIGGALNFNGVGSVDIPTDWASSITDEVTITFWIFGGPEQPKVDRCFETSRPGSEVWFNCTVPYKTGAVNFDAPYPDRVTYYAVAENYKGQWNHYAFTKNRATGEMYIYLNGVQVASKSGKSLPMTPAEGFTQGTIGSGGDGAGGHGRFYYGIIDDFRIYNYEVPYTEIWNIAHQIGEPVPGPVVWYKFDETTGLTAADSAGGYDVPLPRPELDLHKDGKVNFKDFVLFAGRWLEEQLWP